MAEFFPVALFILPLYFILDIDQNNSSSKFHLVLASFILCPSIKLMTNKFQPLTCEVPKKISVRCGDCLITLVLHGAFTSYG